MSSNSGKTPLGHECVCSFLEMMAHTPNKLTWAAINLLFFGGEGTRITE